MANRFASLRPPPDQGGAVSSADLVETAKAVKDYLLREIPLRMEKSFSARLEILEARTKAAEESAAESELRAKTAEKRLEEVLRERHKELSALEGRLGERFEKDFSQKEKSLRDSYQARMASLQEVYAKGLGELRDALKSQDSVESVVSNMLSKSLERETASLVKAHETYSLELREAYQKGLEEASDFFRKDLENTIESWRDSLTKDLSETHRALDDTLDRVKGYYDSRLIELRGVQDKSLADAYASFEKRLAEVKESHSQGFLEIKDFLAALPTPQVILPEGAVKFLLEQKAAEVTVNVPQTAIKVMVPEQFSPAPVVNVSIPKRKVIKHIKYDEQSRPSVIEEREEEQ